MDGNQSPAPRPAAATPPAALPRAYVSATLPGPGEIGALAAFALLVLVTLAMPWMLVVQSNRGGLNFDTWKMLQAGATLESMLPGPAKDYRMGDEGLLATYGNGTWAMCKEHADQPTAVAAWRARWASGAWPPGVLGAATQAGAGQWLAFASLRDGRMLEWVSGKYTLRFFAPDDATLADMIKASQLIDGRGEPHYGNPTTAPFHIRLLRFNAPWAALGLNVLTLALLAGLYFYGIRRLRVPAPAGSRKLGREAMRTRLMGLNTPNSPVAVEEQEPYHLICRWRVDDAELARWMAGRNLREAWQLDIYLDSEAVAGVLETKGSMAWDGRQSPPAPRFSWNYMRAVAASPHGTLPADPAAIVLPTQSIDPAEYRRTLQQLLLSGGWTWKPLLFRPLVWEYR